jgi:hypothetical protein
LNKNCIYIVWRGGGKRKEGSGTIFLSPKFFPIEVVVGEQAQTSSNVEKSSKVLPGGRK